MSTLFSRTSLPRMPIAPVMSLQYREMASALPPVQRMKGPPAPEPAMPRAEVEMSEGELQRLLADVRDEATRTTEARVREEMRVRLEVEAERVTGALAGFETSRGDYFKRVEAEVVRLSLSIAAKILHREAQVDPMLVAALVQIAVNQLKENTAVNVRVHPGSAAQWRARFEAAPQWAVVTVVEDAALEAGDCVLETELGSANFSLAAQLKEVEQGFFDMLAQTPKG
jgi:flagellar assembly protein FliH